MAGEMNPQSCQCRQRGRRGAEAARPGAGAPNLRPDLAFGARSEQFVKNLTGLRTASYAEAVNQHLSRRGGKANWEHCWLLRSMDRAGNTT